MPNYVRNHITFEGDKDEINLMLNFVKNEDGDFDFNKIIPMPKLLAIEEGSRTYEGLNKYRAYIELLNNGGDTSEYLKFKEEHPDVWFLGIAAYNNIERYGYCSWYSWCIDKWGTKWNACDSYVGRDYIEFDTAWSAPMPVIVALSKKFSGITFTMKYADEDIGNNCGMRQWKGGRLTEFEVFDYSRSAIDFACDLWGYDASEYYTG